MTRNYFNPVVRRRVLGAMIISCVILSAGCRSKQGGQDAGTSTGLPYRVDGRPGYVDLPGNFPVYPTPMPAAAPKTAPKTAPKADPKAAPAKK